MQIVAPARPVAQLSVTGTGSVGAQTAPLVERAARQPLASGHVGNAYAEAAKLAAEQGTAQGVFINMAARRYEVAPLTFLSGAPVELATNGAGLLATRIDHTPGDPDGDLQGIVGSGAYFGFSESTDGMPIPAEMVRDLQLPGNQPGPLAAD